MCIKNLLRTKKRLKTRLQTNKKAKAKKSMNKKKLKRKLKKTQTNQIRKGNNPRLKASQSI